MAEINKPDYSQIWASGGAIVAPSSVKVQTGWTAEVPPFQWENWAQNRQDAFIAHINQHGLPVWDATTEYQYSLSGTKSIVMGSNGSVYQAKQTNTNQNPVTDVTNTYWQLAYATLSDVYTKAQVDAKTTIASVAQAQAYTSNTVLITPLRMADAFVGGSFQSGGAGYQKLPNGRIFQWTRALTPGNGAIGVYPAAFTAGPYYLSATLEAGSPAAGFTLSIENTSLSQFTIRYAGTPPTGSWWVNILAIGQ